MLCIFHTLRALFSNQCQFSKFISALLLLNASIFFCLFMNFYMQSYRKTKAAQQLQQQQQQQKQQQQLDATPCKADSNNNTAMLAQKLKAN